MVLFLPAFVLGYLVPFFGRRAAASGLVLLVGVIALLFADLLLGRTTGLRVAQMVAAYVVVGCLSAQSYPRLESRFPQFLGAVSYPFYLMHPALMMIIPTRGNADGWALVGAIALLAVLSIISALAVSWVVHLTIEKPFIRIGNRMVTLPRPMGAAERADGVVRRE